MPVRRAQNNLYRNMHISIIDVLFKIVKTRIIVQRVVLYYETDHGSIPCTHMVPESSRS